MNYWSRREILQMVENSRVNGQMVNLSVLRAIGQHLVDTHGQHDQEELMRPSTIFKMLVWISVTRASTESVHIKRVSLMLIEKCAKKFLEVSKKNQQEHSAMRIEMLNSQMAD